MNKKKLDEELNDVENYRYSGDITSMTPLTKEPIFQMFFEQYGQKYSKRWQNNDKNNST